MDYLKTAKQIETLYKDDSIIVSKHFLHWSVVFFKECVALLIRSIWDIIFYFFMKKKWCLSSLSVCSQVSFLSSARYTDAIAWSFHLLQIDEKSFCHQMWARNRSFGNYWMTYFLKWNYVEKVSALFVMNKTFDLVFHH